MTTEKKPAPMRHCFNCGAEMGRYWQFDPLDTGGAAECNRAARDAHQAERDEADERLDREIAWW